MKNLILFFLFSFISAHADWTDVSSKEFTLAPPPEAGSAIDLLDFEILLEYQDMRTDAECAYASSHEWMTPRVLFGEAADLLTDEEISNVEDLLERAFTFTKRISKHFKKKFERPRPYEIEEALSPCVEKPGGFAYPSTHATIGFLGACILKEIYPELSEELMEQGMYIGELRAIVGVHHPSDIDAARELGAQICDYLLTNGEFLEELSEYL